MIYISDLPFSLQKSNVSMYADDTAISLSSENIDVLQNNLNLNLHIESAGLAACKQTFFERCKDTVNCYRLCLKHSQDRKPA